MDARSNNNKKKYSPLIVEIAGLAGAGKSTLARLISRRCERVTISPELEVRKFDHMPIFAAQAQSLLPVLLQRYQSGRWFTWDEIKYMAYLNGWSRLLSKQVSDQTAIVLLDHGPVFKLATLDAFGPERLKNHNAEKWWNSILKQWAQTLDMVIWLHAPPNILNDRINNRDQKHAVKGKSAQEANTFLAQYRKSYEQILDSLKAYNNLTIIEFDTSSKSIEHVVEEVLDVFNSHLGDISN